MYFKPTSGNALKRLTFKKRMRKFYVISMALIVLISGVYIYWQFYYTYSEGYHEGILLNFANRGNVFKTHEGELLISTTNSNENQSTASQNFYFSVSGQAIAQILDTVQGRTVMVHYQQKNSTIFWRGESEYLVDSVKLIR